MQYLCVAFLFLSSCAFLKTHPEVEEVGEKVLIDGIQIAEQDLEKDVAKKQAYHRGRRHKQENVCISRVYAAPVSVWCNLLLRKEP